MHQWEAFTSAGVRMCSVYEHDGRWVNGRKQYLYFDSPLVTFDTREAAMQDFEYRQSPQPFHWKQVWVPQQQDATPINEQTKGAA